MEAEKYLKILGRMCDSFEACERCPNYRVVCAVDSKKQVDTKKAIKIAEEWEKQHPVKTRLTEFLKICPNAKFLSSSNYPNLCIKHLDSSVECVTVCEECKKKFWEEEVK